MQPCITIGCQLISPLSKYLKALVLTKKVSTLFERTRSLVTFLKNAQNSLSQPDISSPGTISSRGYLSKLDVSEGPCTCKYISFFIYLFFFFSDQDLWCDWGIEGAVVQALPVKALQQDIEESCHHWNTTILLQWRSKMFVFETERFLNLGKYIQSPESLTRYRTIGPAWEPDSSL